MYKSKHYNFITTPIFNILEESVIACRGIGDGIETQTISEYILQTTFLKMTGASEQKLKCICWELATNDYEYRYQYLKKDTDYGECSNYKAKNAIYKELIKEIKKQDDSFDFNVIFNPNNKSEILNKVIAEVKIITNSSIFKLLDEKGFNCFINKANDFCIHNNFADPSNLLVNNLKTHFEKIVYRHRNRCAHNLVSYQENLPTLSTLSDKDYDYNNYFFRFSLLILIDEIFIRLYKKYIDALEKNAYS